jgi:uncharacterized protein (DUF2267 family)
MERNKIGAVIIQDKGHIAGLVTDRDLVVRVFARGLDPDAISVREIMSGPVMTLTPHDAHDDAIRSMREHGIRRIPLVEDDRAVGMVTLDDLLLDEAAPLDELAAVVEVQLGSGGPQPPERSAASRRRAVRAEATLRHLLTRVRDNSGLADNEQAEAALRTVLGFILRRLTPEEAGDLLAQLPSLLQSERRNVPAAPDKSITRNSMRIELMRRLGIDAIRAERVLTAVGATLAQSVSLGQLEDVRGQLPEPLRSILPAAPQASL